MDLVIITSDNLFDVIYRRFESLNSSVVQYFIHVLNNGYKQ